MGCSLQTADGNEVSDRNLPSSPEGVCKALKAPMPSSPPSEPSIEAAVFVFKV